MASLSAIVYSPIKRFFKEQVDFWLKKRIPASLKQRLSNRNVFIFPTKFGFLYLFFDLILFLLATNYQNNLIMLLSYLLASLFISVMLHSFFNLSGLQLEAKSRVKGFAGSSLYLPIKLVSSKGRFNLNFSFAQQAVVHLAILNEKGIKNTVSEVLVPLYCAERGIFTGSRVKLSSEFSLGLFTCWTQLAFASTFIVYPDPKPVNLKLTNNQLDDEIGQSTQVEDQGDDFYQLKNYVLGEPLSQVAWKHLAKGQGWFSKSNQQNVSQQPWLNLSEMPSVNIEQKLRYLCYLVKEYNQQGIDFGVVLGDRKIAPAQGKDHLELCLMALAEFGHCRQGER